jgi:hypothetical protein
METYPLCFIESQDILTDINDMGDSNVCVILTFQLPPFRLM